MHNALLLQSQSTQAAAAAADYADDDAQTSK